jgi:hypothetical protein
MHCCACPPAACAVTDSILRHMFRLVLVPTFRVLAPCKELHLLLRSDVELMQGVLTDGLLSHTCT